MDTLRRSMSTVKRCRKAVWISLKSNFLLSCFGCRRTSTARRTTEHVPDGVTTAADADDPTINENISATKIDVSSEKVQLSAAMNSSKTEEENDPLNGVTRKEGQPRDIMDEAENKVTAAAETVRNVSRADENKIVDGSEKPDHDSAPNGDADNRCRHETAATETVRNVCPGGERQQLDENKIVGGSEKPDLDDKPNGDADNRCQPETTSATPMMSSSVSLKVEHVNDNTATKRSEIRKFVGSYNNGAPSRRSKTTMVNLNGYTNFQRMEWLMTKNECSIEAKVVDNEETKAYRISRLPVAMPFSPERIRSAGRNRQLSVGSGMINNGVICYINSTLQALFHIPAFTNWLMNDQTHQKACRQKVICKDLSTDRQEDAHEFLCYLIGSIKRNCVSVFEHADEFPADACLKETTPVSEIFGGYVRTEVTCGECANKSITCQYLQDIILDIKRSNNVCDALKAYFDGEQLSYACGTCRREVVAEKRFMLEKAPNVLCVQLNRFDAGGSYGRKINKVVETNERLELSGSYVCGTAVPRPLRYRLVSMVMHHGTSLNSGHYTAVCLTAAGSYYCFDDRDVYKTSFGEHSKSKNSYIMFYGLDSSDDRVMRIGARRKNADKKSGTA